MQFIYDGAATLVKLLENILITIISIDELAEDQLHGLHPPDLTPLDFYRDN